MRDKLVSITNRKSHVGFRLAPKSVTLNDLERSAKDKLERRSQERSTKTVTHLGRGGDSSSRQTRTTSECGATCPRGRGMNQGHGQGRNYTAMSVEERRQT